MALDSTHPLYSTFLTDWKMCRDSYRGERIVKNAGQLYLPATSGMVADGMNTEQGLGYQAYQAYKERAVFHDYVKQAVETMIGMMWAKPPTIELPPQLEDMRDSATTKNESLNQLLRRINEQQLVAGRCGILLDLPTTPNPEQPLPYIAMYNAEHIINWDDGLRDEVVVDSLNMVVLDESEYVRNADFEWEFEDKFRVLLLGETLENEASGDYSVGVFDEDTTNFNENAMITPSIRGNTLQEIPFVFVNSKDIVATPDDPPLLGLARLGMAIYRGEADYRQSLFLQGQDTLVVVGAGEDNFRVGAGASLTLPQGGDAKFIGVSSDGLGEQRQALENDKMQASNKSGELVDTRSREKESGDALRTRSAAQTATLNQIALAGAEGLQTLLRKAAVWVGANPDEVVVTPNLDFANQEMTGKALMELMTAKTLGAPLSSQSIHRTMQNKDMTELDYEEELALIDEEAPIGLQEPEEENEEI